MMLPMTTLSVRSSGTSRAASSVSAAITAAPSSWGNTLPTPSFFRPSIARNSSPPTAPAASPSGQPPPKKTVKARAMNT